MKNVIVVGAGAAGLTAAIRAAEAGAGVTLLNAHPRIGLKILMSGGTRCNVTHAEVGESDFNGGSRAFVRSVLRAFPAERAREWLEGLGVDLKLEPSGKYFPVTDDAQTVLDALVRGAERAGVQIVPGARVIRVERCGRNEEARAAARFRIGIQRVRDSAAFSAGASAIGVTEWRPPAIEPDERMSGDALVIATGGLSFPRTGSDGTGYALVTGLGHTLVPPVPALTPLAADDPLCKNAQGITLEAELTLWVGGKRATVIRGSLLIAHFGYSGPAALDLSRHWLRAGASGRRVTVSFMPDLNSERALATWREAAAAEPRVSLRRYLGRWLPDRLAVELCREAGSEPSTALGQVDRESRRALIERVVARELPITGTLGYEKAEVTAGGVTLDEVNPSTLESRVVPDLYLCGEILDVEGRLGGFNFQLAWSSGTVAGRAAADESR